MKRYSRLFFYILKYQYLGEMSFNVNFIVNILMHLTWIIIPVCYYNIIYSRTTMIAGWSYEEVLILIGTFQVFEGINQLTYFRGVFFEIANSIQTGSLDFILLKPVNSQFLITFKGPDIFGLTDVITGVLLIIWAVIKLEIQLNLYSILVYTLLLLNGVVISYTIFFLLSITAFITISRSDLLDIFDSAIDESIQKPVEIYAKQVKIIFTYIIPIFVMVSFPVKAFLTNITAIDCFTALISSSLFLFFTVIAWRHALRHYSSASS